MGPRPDFLRLLLAVWLIGQTGAAVTAQVSGGGAGRQGPRRAVPVVPAPPSAGPVGAEKPDGPDDPAEPEEPREPDEPRNPGEPRDPEEPEEPRNPGDPANPAPPPSSGVPEPDFTLRPGASLSWDQDVTARVPVSALSFTLYVDGEAQRLQGVRCTTASASTQLCSVPAPALPPGLHALTISASDGSEESPRSQTMLVRVEGAGMTASTATAAVAGTLPSAGVFPLPLVDPSDVLVVSADLALMSERQGRVRAVRAGRIDAAPALTLDDVRQGDGHGLLALAAGPDVARTGTVYLLYSAGAGLRVARAQLLSQGTLSRPVVIVDGLPAAGRAPRAAMRVGPDGTVYVALGDGGDRARAHDLGDWAGKLLRFTPDGTTPRDQPAASPVVLAGLSAPAALTWQASTDTWWLADVTADGGVVLHRMGPAAAGRPAASITVPVGSPVGRVSIAAGQRAGEVFLALTGVDGAGLGVRRLEIAPDGHGHSNREIVPAGPAILGLVAPDASGELGYWTAQTSGRVRVR